MSVRFRFARFGRAVLVAAVLTAAGTLPFTARRGVETDVCALLGRGADPRADALTAAVRDEARFLVRAPNREAAEARVDALTGPVARPSRSSSVLAAVEPLLGGVLSSGTRAQLERGDFAAVRDAALARLYSPAPQFVSVKKDPFLLFSDYAANYVPNRPGWQLVSRTISAGEAAGALARLEGETSSGGTHDLYVSGAPFHTARAAARSKREVNLLGGVSLVAVLALGWWLFRSVRFAPVLLVALAAAFTTGTAAVFAVFPRPHALTFVFGTSLIGLGVDYVYHALAARGTDIRAPLTHAMLSTVACFAPLLVSGVTVLNQMALFTIAGLVTVYAVARETGCARRSTDSHGPKEDVPRRTPSPAGVPGGGRTVAHRLPFVFHVFLFFLLAAVVLGISRVEFGNDVASFYRPDAFLLENEKTVAEACGGAFVPPLARQRENAALVRELYAREGTNYCAAAGLPLSVLAAPDESRFFDPKEELSRLFDAYGRETYRLLGVSFALLTVFLAVLFRRRFLRCALPVACANAATLAVLGALGEKVTFFHALCFFVFTGLGIDYTVFLMRRRNAETDARRTVLVSFLTSFVGLGMLAFTEFAVTRGMGITLATGIFFSYAFARMFAHEGEREDGAERAAAWYDQREQSAGAWRMAFMWWTYRLFGKRVQKAVASVVMLFVYPFAKPARRALCAYYDVLAERTGTRAATGPARERLLFRHLLGFAYGMIDKTDVCTLRKSPPRVTPREDDGWRAFRAFADARRGVFLVCTHLGTIEVLPALEAEGPVPHVHAFQQMGHDSEFMKVFMRHFDARAFSLHAVEEIGVETAVTMKEAVARGELVMMAGDRVSAGAARAGRNVLHADFLGRDCAWPKGVFAFASLMEAPVFAVTCVRTAPDVYEARFARLDEGGAVPSKDALCRSFVSFLERETLAFPDQWYQFYDFFGAPR